MATVINTDNIEKIVTSTNISSLPTLWLTNGVNQTTGVSTLITLPAISISKHLPELEATPNNSITVKIAGEYKVRGNVTITPNTNGIVTIGIYKNNVMVYATKNNVTAKCTLSLETILNLQENDVITLVYVGPTGATISGSAGEQANLAMYKISNL